VTSHLGDVLRRARVPSRLEFVAHRPPEVMPLFGPRP
jgi:hypothetical protein